MAHWSKKYQKCNDGGKHDGLLELKTWIAIEDDTELGWGGVLIQEAEDHKKNFITKYNSDEEKFYEYWPQGFRWTCCGMDGDVDNCDHHGTGSTPCTCDYCMAGKPIPKKYKLQRESSQAGKGLTLSGGPDPRSGPAQCQNCAHSNLLSFISQHIKKK